MDQRAPEGKTPEIWVGACGPRMLRLTGQYADGWLPYPITSPQEYADKLKIVRAAAQEAGRDPSAITAGLVQFIAVAPTQEEVLKMQNSKMGRLFALMAPAKLWRNLGSYGIQAGCHLWTLGNAPDRSVGKKPLIMVALLCRARSLSVLYVPSSILSGSPTFNGW
jgi:alkanesulfonate monooxygenase SsuD/methylene tetrahydromethanopterin reductase-like flavin-dependent oxidoreductase (luciferase family)